MTEESLQQKAAKIKLFIFDFDGVFTDGKIHYHDGNQQRKTRVFDVQDGLGINLARQAGIKTAIITGSLGFTVRDRANDLYIDILKAGYLYKVDAYREILKKLKIKEEETAYMGDDIIDLPLLCRVGLSIAVQNARPEVKEHVDMVTERTGGDGAIREAVEFILKAKGLWQDIIDDYLADGLSAKALRPNSQ